MSWTRVSSGVYEHTDGSRIVRVIARGRTNRLGTRWRLFACGGSILRMTLSAAKRAHADGFCGKVGCETHLGPCAYCFRPVKERGAHCCGAVLCLVAQARERALDEMAEMADKTSP